VIIKKHYGVKDIPFVEGAYGKSVVIISNNKVILAVWVRGRRALSEFVHELIHTLIGLFDTIDHPLKHDNDEPIAYLAEYLTKQFIDKKDWKVFTNVRKH
jgi:hypothetical protein